MVKIKFLLLIGLILSILPSLHAQSIIEWGSGYVVGEDIQHPNGLVFDQVLMTGESIRLRAKPGNITRISLMDVNEDIVQIEFSGAGKFTVTLDPETFQEPKLPPRYNQLTRYVTGKPWVMIEEADATTFFSIFTVGRINAVNQNLFYPGAVYDGQADIRLVEVRDSTGIGGLQLSNVLFSGNKGKVGINAHNVPVAVRLILGDIEASGPADPYLLFGQDSFTIPADNSGLIIAGGDLYQPNGKPIVSILDAANLFVAANVKSNGEEIQAKEIRGNFNFIDQAVITPPEITDPTTPEEDETLAPKTLNRKGYAYNFGGSIFFLHYNGSSGNSGPAIFSVHELIGGVWYTLEISGDFGSAPGVDDPNIIHVVMEGYTAQVSIDDVTVRRGTVQEIAHYLNSPIYRDITLVMKFQTPKAGTVILEGRDTSARVIRNNGTFQQL